MNADSVNSKTFSTDTFARIPLLAITTTYNPPTVRIIDGFLSEGRRLARPLNVLIDYDEEEVVVSEPRFHIHASAPTEAEAVAAFRRIFSGYLDILASREETLSTYLREQLHYLRSIIRLV